MPPHSGIGGQGGASNAARQHESWVPNADAWVAAVRSGAIASRRNGTDAAVIAACAAEPGQRVLDAGCGEGWLVRALAERGAVATGTDGSVPLVAAAQEAGTGMFMVASYDELIADPSLVAGPFDLVVCNFSLLDADLAPLLGALRRRLAPQGRLVIQTVHPIAAAGDEGYRDGWREERFAAFGGGFVAPMPWFYRTISSWVRTLHEGGLALDAIDEPRDAEGALLSLILHGRAAG